MPEVTFVDEKVQHTQAMLERIADRERRRQEREATRPSLDRGDRVVVHQAGITDYAGTVQAVKHSGPTKTWWLEVELEDGMTWSVPASHVTKMPEAIGG